MNIHKQNIPSKKVGIISMQRVPNYGSFLQAYALRRLLELQGAEVHFVDIEPGVPVKGYEIQGIAGKLFSLKRLFQLTLNGKLFSRVRGIPFQRRINAKFYNDYHPLLKFGQVIESSYDLVVIGSDEVFNCCQRTTWGFTQQLYGKVSGASKVISYAGSFGRTTYGELEQCGLTDKIAESFSHLSAISVRDDNSEEIVRRLTRQQPFRHLDPVLIYDFKDEIAQCSVPVKDYILIYSYQTHIWSRSEIEAVQQFARSHSKRILSIFCQYDWCDEAVIPDTPFGVLAYFKAADFVVTETFHGTIFSIITNSRFCTLLRDSNRLKLTSLLRGLKLEKRILTAPACLEQLLSSPIDYEPTEDVLRRERRRTAEYLMAALLNS